MTEQNTVIESMIVIDDDAVDQLLHKRAIDQSGLVAGLKTFDSAETALEFFRERPSQSVDIILLDISMPRMDGFDFLEVTLLEFDYPIAKLVALMVSTLDAQSRNKASEFELVRFFVEKPLQAVHLEEMSKMLDRNISATQN